MKCAYAVACVHVNSVLYMMCFVILKNGSFLTGAYKCHSISYLCTKREFFVYSVLSNSG